MTTALRAIFLLGSLTAASAQTLTDWRAQVDADLSRISMPRDAHAQVIGVLQEYERRAMIEKAKAEAEKARKEQEK